MQSEIPVGIPITIPVAQYQDFNSFLNSLSEFELKEKVSFNSIMRPPLKYKLMKEGNLFLKIEELRDEEPTWAKYSSINCKKFKLKGTYYPLGDNSVKIPVFTLYKMFTCCCHFSDYTMNVELEGSKGAFMGDVIFSNKGCCEINESALIDNEEPINLQCVEKNAGCCFRGLQQKELHLLFKKGEKQVGEVVRPLGNINDNIMGLVKFICKLNPTLTCKQKLMTILSLAMVCIIYCPGRRSIA